jgi:hypothetical protein
VKRGARAASVGDTDADERKTDLKKEPMCKRAKDFVPDPMTMLSVYVPGADGRSTRCMGFIMSRGKAGFEAFDANDRSLGLYPNQKGAADALSSRVEAPS